MLAWDDFQILLRVFCDTLYLMFAFPRHSAADFESTVGVVDAMVQQLTNELRRINSLSDENITEHEFYKKLMCAYVLGTCLHALRSISYQGARSASLIEQHKGAAIRSKMQTISDCFSVMCATAALPNAAIASGASQVQEISIVHDVHQQFHSFGKYYSELNSSRWLGISAALHMMRFCDQHRREDSTSSYVATEVSIPLLQECIEQIELCAKESVSHMLNCIRLLVSHFYDLHMAGVTDGNLSDQLEALLFAAWISCTDDDGLCYQNIKLFFQLCFDKHTLMIISPSAQQVMAYKHSFPCFD